MRTIWKVILDGERVRLLSEMYLQRYLVRLQCFPPTMPTLSGKGAALIRQLKQVRTLLLVLKSNEMKTFIERDTVDGEWLSPIKEEREWQEQKLAEIFKHYPKASPRWQYLNGLIEIALEHIKTKDKEDGKNGS